MANALEWDIHPFVLSLALRGREGVQTRCPWKRAGAFRQRPSALRRFPVSLSLSLRLSHFLILFVISLSLSLYHAPLFSLAQPVSLPSAFSLTIYLPVYLSSSSSFLIRLPPFLPPLHGRLLSVIRTKHPIGRV